MPKFKKDEIYPRSPLVEVVCELRFAPNLAIDGLKHDIQNRLRGTYPNLLLPRIEESPWVGGAIYRFETDDRTAGVAVAFNRIAAYEKKYGGHQSLISRFFDALGVLTELIEIREPARLGWRYINHIPFVRVDGAVPLGHFLQVDLLQRDLRDRHVNFDLTVSTKMQDGDLTTRLAVLTQPQTGQEAILLDFDHALTKSLHINRLRPQVFKAHKRTREMFENLITDEYREFLRGVSE